MKMMIYLFVIVSMMSSCFGFVTAEIAFGQDKKPGIGCKESKDKNAVMAKITLLSKVGKKYYYARRDTINQNLCGIWSDTNSKFPRFVLVSNVPRPKDKILKSGYCARNIKLHYVKVVKVKDNRGFVQSYRSWEIVEPDKVIFKPCPR